MIIDSPYIIELARGVERRVIQDGDVQLVVPPILGVGVDLVLPHIFAIATGTVANTSATATFGNTKTNGGATNQEILRLPPGLWTLQCNLSARANYTTIGTATPDILVRLITPALTNAFNLLSLFVTVGSHFALGQKFDVMLTETQIVQVVIQPNGVGQTIDSLVSINAIRRL